MSTLYELGYREGLEPAAHEIAETLVTTLAPTIPLGDVAAQDAPFVRRILMVAAQVGAGIGIVEARTSGPPPRTSDPVVWAVLWRALDDLPALPRPQRFAAAFLLTAGYYVARTGEASVGVLSDVLRTDLSC